MKLISDIRRTFKPTVHTLTKMTRATSKGHGGDTDVHLRAEDLIRALKNICSILVNRRERCYAELSSDRRLKNQHLLRHHYYQSINNSKGSLLFSQPKNFIFNLLSYQALAPRLSFCATQPRIWQPCRSTEALVALNLPIHFL